MRFAQSIFCAIIKISYNSVFFVRKCAQSRINYIIFPSSCKVKRLTITVCFDKIKLTMAKITSIEPQVKDKERCNVFIDGRFYCGVKLEVAVKYRLKAGMEIERSRLDEIQLETEKAQAMDKAMTHLSSSPKTCRQINDFLIKKGYVQAVADYVIQRLKEYGYLDDAEYCREYMRTVSGKSVRAAMYTLLARGVEKSVAEEALAQFSDDGEKILAILEKYLRGKPHTRENIYKGYKYLLSKGYEADAAKEACEKIGDEDN